VLEACDLIVARVLGSPQLLCSGFDRLRSNGKPMVVLGGEQTPDASLMAMSTVSMGIAADAHVYLAHGGPDNLGQLHAFLSDTVLLTGVGFEPPVEQPLWGVLSQGLPAGQSRPRIGILFYRAQYAAGNTGYVEALVDAVDAAGGIGIPIFATSLRDAPSDLLEYLATCDALITTVLAAGGTKPATASAGGDDEAWDVRALAALDVPILQGLCLTWDRASWAASEEGMTPLDVATQVAVPEFDGRIITVPFSFKETDGDGLPTYVADHERCRRVAEIAVNHARLRHIPPAERRIAILLSAYPTKHARIGNAVGLDTPVSVIKLLRAMRTAGYDVGEPGEIPGTGAFEPVEGEHPDTTAGNALIHALIAAGGQDPEWLTAEQLAGQPVRISAQAYRRWLATLPADLVAAVTAAWGEAPGELFVDRSSNPEGEIVAATLKAGNVVILVQPPRGFGENPIAIYHDPDLAPSHHYLAVYRWLEQEFAAHAVIHVGKHGNLEWLPGKNLGLSASCGTDAAIGSLPLIYPFLVNDPGEGTQAKRRAHATIVDHLVPPMARAETYGDIARLEQLLDEYAHVNAMDPAKAPALRGEIWTLIQAAQLDHDLGLNAPPEAEAFDEFVLHVDGWLCEIKDAQIRDGLHVLGQPPQGEELINLVLAVLRSAQVFGGRGNAVQGLRAALGLAADAPIADVDATEAQARQLVGALAASGWSVDAVPEVVDSVLGGPHEAAAAALRFACQEVVPRLARTGDEITAILHALDGGYVPAGPSGSPLRGLINVLPTGRNFYSVDPKAIPSRMAYQTGQAMAESLLQRHVDEAGEYPQSVGLSVWGTSAMRTSGDDVAEVLALLGVMPVWDDASRRVVGLEAIDLGELGRPRIDVTVRISGFFRDAFPHVLAMLDDAVRLVADLDEPRHVNFVRKHAQDDLATHGDQRRSTTRIFGSKPGSYGAGMLPLMEAGNWRDDHDLAEVYSAWGGFAYGRDLDGMPAREDMEANYRRIAVAAKNVDTHEHDIADSDDYFQYHGGMVATVRALTGVAPKAYVGDSTTPEAVRTRSLTEETARVFRARVINPRWISAMQRHGYKGAFELAATVDYLFGFDATAGVVPDWMYAQLAENYVLDKDNQDFMKHANPWALRGMIEKLSEAVDRGLWEDPDPDVITQLQQVYLDVEGDLEDVLS
jgi:cobaltochelatase CobN